MRRSAIQDAARYPAAGLIASIWFFVGVALLLAFHDESPLWGDARDALEVLTGVGVLIVATVSFPGGMAARRPRRWIRFGGAAGLIGTVILGVLLALPMDDPPDGAIWRFLFGATGGAGIGVSLALVELLARGRKPRAVTTASVAALAAFLAFMSIAAASGYDDYIHLLVEKPSGIFEAAATAAHGVRARWFETGNSAAYVIAGPLALACVGVAATSARRIRPLVATLASGLLGSGLTAAFLESVARMRILARSAFFQLHEEAVTGLSSLSETEKRFALAGVLLAFAGPLLAALARLASRRRPLALWQRARRLRARGA